MVNANHGAPADGNTASTFVRSSRTLHPGAWWIWALGMSAAATQTTNPLLLILIIGAAAFVVSARRTDAPWALGFKAYLYLGVFIIIMRVAFRAVFDSQYGEHILFTLPELPLPDVAAGIRIGGPVSAEGLVAAFNDGLRLAALVICLGAANVLANPKRLLKIIPSALYEVGVAVTVALTMAPQLVASGQRIHAARKLRGDVGKRTKWFKAVVVPVITDALDRSILLASAMDSRGYGRRVGLSKKTRFITSSLLIIGLLGICVGLYGLLSGGAALADSTGIAGVGANVLKNAVPTLIFGVMIAAIGFMWSGKRVRRTRYRPDPWKAAEWVVALAGVAVAAAFFVVASIEPTMLSQSVSPLQWPSLPAPAVAAIAVGILPAWLAPPPSPKAGSTTLLAGPSVHVNAQPQRPPHDTQESEQSVAAS